MTETELDIAKLREIAQAATQSKWENAQGKVVTDWDNDGYVVIAENPCPRAHPTGARAKTWRADAAHIATFDPPTVLALLDRLEEAEKRLGLDRIGTHAPDCHMWGPKHYECLRREFQDAQARIEALKGALRPFAEMARYGDKHAPDTFDNQEVGVSVGQLRTAARVLGEGKP